MIETRKLTCKFASRYLSIIAQFVALLNNFIISNDETRQALHQFGRDQTQNGPQNTGKNGKDSFIDFQQLRRIFCDKTKRKLSCKTHGRTGNLTGAQNRCGIAFPALGPRCNMKQERKRAPESSNFSCDSGKWGWEEGGRGGGWNKTRKKK